MALKIKVKTVDVDPPWAHIQGDMVSPDLPDAGECRLRVCDAKELEFFKVGLSYTLTEEADWTDRARKWFASFLNPEGL